MHRFLFFLFCAALPFSSSPLDTEAAQVSTIGTEVGRYAPPIELEELAGTTVSLESLKGSVVLLTFWSVQCSPCMAKMPSLNRLHAAMRDTGLHVVSVAIDEADQPVRDYAVKTEIAFAVLLDKSRDVFVDGYGAPGLPATYLIDRNGIIVEKFNGLAVWDAPEMKNRVMMLLLKK